MRKNKLLKKIKYDVIFYFVRIIIGFFRILPRRAALFIGSVIGRIIPYFARKEFNRAVKNLTIAFGEEKEKKEIFHLARETFRYMAMNFVETARIKVMSKDEVKECFVPHNSDRLWNAVKQGEGIIGLTAHVGCWELNAVYLTAIGVKVSAIAKKLYDPRLEKMLLESRAIGGIHIISRGGKTRDIVRDLKEKRFLIVLVDQDTKVKGVFVDFFGKPAHTALSPAQLSLNYNIPILPFFTYRDNRHIHHACFGEPITIEPTGDKEKDMEEITLQCSKATENFIREHPEQWVWFHKRWKTKPPKNK